MKNEKAQRLMCIDVAKFISILAALTDHLWGTLYFNENIQYITFFSVTTFIILSGVTSYYSNDRHAEGTVAGDIIRRTKGILLPYAVAVFVYQIAAHHNFDFGMYLKYLIGFNITGPFYFVAFYVQLVAISPYVHSAINALSGKRCHKVLTHGCFIIAAIMISIICTKYTYMADIYGGGRYLLGGGDILRRLA